MTEVSGGEARLNMLSAPPHVSYNSAASRRVSAWIAPSIGPSAPSAIRRIVYLWDADYPWDVRVEKICRSLTKLGHDVHIVARNRSDRAERETLAEGYVHRMPTWRRFPRLDAALDFPAFFNPRWIRHLTRVVDHIGPDVIIARDLPLCPTAIHVGRRRGIPVIHDMAEHYPAMIGEIYSARRQRLQDYVLRNPGLVAAVERYCIRRADRIIVVIDEMRERLVALGVPRDRIDVVSNTPPRELVMTPLGNRVRSDVLRVVYLGIMEIPRGIGDLIAAAAVLRDSGFPIRVDLVGTGRDIEIFQAKARRLGLDERDVRFHGYVSSHEEALRIVAEADVGVLPHRRCEHWDHTIPNKLFDYMALGLPVVSSDAKPFARIVRQTGCGEVFRSHDAADLARAIRTVDTPERRRDYAANGQHAIVQQYNWERDAGVLLECIERAVLPDRERK